jgi:glutamate racemase
LDKASPIGVFDSGVGGLSILKVLQAQMPHEQFVYVADSSHAPYGERDASFVQQRAAHLLQILREQHQVKALVVACNTATALAIQNMRSAFPELPMFGVEPAIKPAAAMSHTKRVGVMATPATLQSDKFQTLLSSLLTEAEFVLQACEGLADAIEQQWQHTDNQGVVALCKKYVEALGAFGTQAGQMDVLVLGCTHYPFAMQTLRALVGPQVQIVETGVPVARHTHSVLEDRGLLSDAGAGGVVLLATGDTHNLQHAANMWLQSTTALNVQQLV